MHYQFSRQTTDDFRTVLLRGKKTLKVARDVWSRLHDLIREEHLTKLLVLDEMDDNLSVWDIVEIEGHLRSLGFPRSVFVAIVDAEASTVGNLNAFSELFAGNRGWNRIGVFSSRERALAWLRESSWSPVPLN